MADFEMSNFHHFPMEKSSYDLKLELLEELDPKVALELMKAGNGFRSIYLQDPWRIIGRHVYSVDFSWNRNTIKIYKFRQSAPLHCDPLFHLPLLKKIRSCVEYDSSGYGSSVYGWYLQTYYIPQTVRKMLSNLDSIGETWVGNLAVFKEYFSNFKGHITERIGLNFAGFSGNEDDPTISNVFEMQLRKCKIVAMFCDVDRFSIICKLLSKTMTKWIQLSFDTTEQFFETDLEMAIGWILCNGIPSQNREARIWIYFSGAADDHSRDILDKFLSAFPEMQQMPYEYVRRRYRRKIDDERDCIYAL